MPHMNAQELFEKISAGPQGKIFCEDTLLRLSEDACRRYGKPKDAEKAVKAELHQMTGMFVSPTDVKRGYKLLEDESLSPEELSLSLLKLHASSRERLSQLQPFYDAIFSRTGPVSSILDIGCGLNPMALDAMTLTHDAVYYACDVNLSTVDLVNRYFARRGMPATAFGYDVLSRKPLPDAELVFLFKILPLLEQQKKGGADEFLRSLNARVLAVTFPLRTLSGRNVGMETFYRTHYLPILQANCRQLHSCIVGDEWLCLLER